MSQYIPQRVRDPLHDLINFEASDIDNALWDVIQTRPFQRLRRVKQLGFSELVYPGATHTRFSHSIGVLHTAKLLMKNIETSLVEEKRYNQNKAQVALAAALVHDVGHGPFSHSFETVAKALGLPNLKHEQISGRIIRDSEISDLLNNALGSGCADDVATLIENDGATDIYSSVVSSQFDADRLDYMRRDKLMTGTQHSEIDFTWLISNLRIGSIPYGVDDQEIGEAETLVLDSKALFAAEAYVLGLFQLYPTVYFHKATRSAEKIFTELLMRLNCILQDTGVKNTGLPASHPLVKFFKKPSDLDHFLNLDDTVIWGGLSQMCDAKDRPLADLAKRLRDRKLWKSKDLVQLVRAELDLPASVSIEEADKIVERTTLTAIEQIKSWSADNSGELPRMVIDRADRTPYKRHQSEASKLNQMLIQTDQGLRDLAEVSDVVKASKNYKLRRVYFAPEDTDVEKAIDRCIKASAVEGVTNVT